MLAVAHRNTGVIQTLLGAPGLDLEVKDEPGGWTAAHHAAQAGDMLNAQMLVNAGCNPLPVGAANETPVYVAQEAGHDHIARLFAGRVDWIIDRIPDPPAARRRKS